MYVIRKQKLQTSVNTFFLILHEIILTVEKHHGAVDESSSEDQFHKHNFLSKNLLVLVGVTTGRLISKKLMNANGYIGLTLLISHALQIASSKSWSQCIENFTLWVHPIHLYKCDSLK